MGLPPEVDKQDRKLRIAFVSSSCPGREMKIISLKVMILALTEEHVSSLPILQAGKRGKAVTLTFSKEEQRSGGTERMIPTPVDWIKQPESTR